MGAKNRSKRGWRAAWRAGISCVCLLGLPAAVARPEPPRDRTPVFKRLLAKGFPGTARGGLSHWPEGPVRYLLSSPETRLYRNLKTDRARRGFIKQFWLRRDPDAATIENEFRFDFWERVASANQLFTRTTVPGWKTDRGRLYILMGPPDQVERQPMPNKRRTFVTTVLAEDGSRITHVFGKDKPGDLFQGLERWTYRSRPDPRLPPHFVVAFRLTPSGDYELSSDARDWTLFSDMMSESVRDVLSPPEEGLTDPGKNTDFLDLYNDVAVVMDLGSLNQVPTPDDLLGELITSEEFFGLIPFLLQVDYYKTTGPATLTVFTIGIDPDSFPPGSAPSADDLLTVGRIEAVNQPGREILLTGKDSLVPAPREDGQGLFLYQVVKPLPPGIYNATFGILDSRANRAGSYRERLTVPAFPATGLSLSSLSLAQKLEPMETSEPLGEEVPAAPFRLGNYQVIPKTRPRFSNGDEFGLYYQIYGAEIDPASGEPRLDVTYRFSVLQNGKFTPIGGPIRYANRSLSVQGWSFPILHWPVATFHLQVTVKDMISGEVAVGQTVFSIDDAGASPSGSGL